MLMFDGVIRAALRNPWLVVAAALLLLGTGGYVVSNMPVDVLPDLSAPSVTVVTEANGMAPEEVEQLVTIPLEQALNGAAGVRRLRSSSGVGISLVWVEFDWDLPLMAARQVVAEKVSAARSSLPANVEPVMAPMSSIMGEIMFVGVTGDKDVGARDVRDTAEWLVRRRLLGVPGIAQVIPLGGQVKQIQVVLDPVRLQTLRVGVDDVAQALRGAFENTPGGFHVAGAQEYLIRGMGRVTSLGALEQTLIAERNGATILVRDVATVQVGSAIKRGDAAVDGQEAVVLKVQKQPHANTLELTARVDEVLDDIGASLPRGMKLYRKGFRQADFIRVALRNVEDALRDGAILVALVLAMFLLSWRTTFISLIALPLSLLAGVLVLQFVGASINTMTLGGFAIAIGELVDDAIIDVENVHRRLRENLLLPLEARRKVFDVVLDASREIRSSVVYATLIIMMVFSPLFFLSGIEGRLLRPLGMAYVASTGASLVVALTITPALCLLLLGGRQSTHTTADGALVRWLQSAYRAVLVRTMPHAIPTGVLSAVGAALALVLMASFGRSFLPAFNEGSLNIAAATAPGTSLATSVEMVQRLEKALLKHPAVTSVIRCTGRAERDEHAQDVNFSELEVGLRVQEGQREQVMQEVRALTAAVPGLASAVGQPIGHRIEHLMSGVRASLVVKFFGDDLEELRSLARLAGDAMKAIPGLVDVNVEQQTDIPQLLIRPKPTELAAFGMTPGTLARLVETAWAGEPVATWWEGQRAYDLMVRLPTRYRDDPTLLGQMPVDVRGERFVTLSSIATLDKTLGPNLINHEGVQRRMLVTANVAGRDAHGAAQDVLMAVHDAVKLPPRYHMALGGEFESEAHASSTILWLSLMALMGMAALLFMAFRSARDAALVMVNLPLALVGGVAAVSVGGGVLSIASLVGFVTLFGIATRNGIMMVTHYRHLLRVEGTERNAAILQGSLDRLVPVLMTALTAALALLPVAFSAGEPGNEIQAPMAAVILGGLVSSTVLNLLVLPALFARFGTGQRVSAS